LNDGLRDDGHFSGELQDYRHGLQRPGDYEGND
jgi:hypothetical protein